MVLASPPSPYSEDPIAGALELFGNPRTFRLDRAAIQRRYYELSRELHPDRFMRAAPEERAEAVARMSSLNETYELLMDADAWREYLLGGFADRKGKLPLELASDWFELQDEGPDSEQLGVFRDRVIGELEAIATRIAGLEADADASAWASDVRERAIEKLKDAVLSRNTVQSLLRDVDRAIEHRSK